MNDYFIFDIPFSFVDNMLKKQHLQPIHKEFFAENCQNFFNGVFSDKRELCIRVNCMTHRLYQSFDLLGKALVIIAQTKLMVASGHLFDLLLLYIEVVFIGYGCSFEPSFIFDKVCANADFTVHCRLGINNIFLNLWVKKQMYNIRCRVCYQIYSSYKFERKNMT